MTAVDTICYKRLQGMDAAGRRPRNMRRTMRFLAALLTAVLLSPAFAQPPRGHGHAYGPPPGPRYGAQPGPYYGGQPGPYYGGPPRQYYAPQQDTVQRPMPPPEQRMGWEERQRLREQVNNGQMSREEARARWREQRAADPERFSREQREQLRRDVMDVNR